MPRPQAPRLHQLCRSHSPPRYRLPYRLWLPPAAASALAAVCVPSPQLPTTPRSPLRPPAFASTPPRYLVLLAAAVSRCQRPSCRLSSAAATTTLPPALPSATRAEATWRLFLLRLPPVRRFFGRPSTGRCHCADCSSFCRRSKPVLSCTLLPMPPASQSLEHGTQVKERLEEGLRLLGMRPTSGRSVLHLLARQLPSGMFDGHRSAMVAPDHLLFHGLTKRLVTGTFRLLTCSQRQRVGVSLREALAHSQFPTTSVYNAKRDKVSAVGISEWAATLTVFGFVLRRTLRSATRSRADTAAGTKSPLHRALEVIDAFTALVCAAYFYPRAELDGISACRARPTPRELQQHAERFFSLVQDACLRTDFKSFGLWLDVPNLHRLRELVDHVIPALLHVRHAQELLFENAHQPLKRAVLSGNGRGDASRALRRYLQAELSARLMLHSRYFGVPDDWVRHSGVRACLRRARPLWSQDGSSWRCSGAVLHVDSVPEEAQSLAKSRVGPETVVKWRSRATRGDAGTVRIGDCVSVLVVGVDGLEAVNVAVGDEAARLGAKPAYYRVVAFFTTGAGTAAAVVQPFAAAAGGVGHVSVLTDRYMFLPMPGVRRALLLHKCQCRCAMSTVSVNHNPSNEWVVFGRDAGYPSRGG